MKKIVHFLAIMAALVGMNVGFVKILIFLYHQWGWLGIGAGFTFVPPIFIVPIWDWVATGHYLTFLLVYLLGFGGIGLWKLTDD